MVLLLGWQGAAPAQDRTGSPEEILAMLPVVMLVVERDMSSEEVPESMIYRGFIQGYMTRELGFMGLR
ncbi:MAG: hypothetical protein RLO50_22455 [Azospirillaceae bacterium]